MPPTTDLMRASDSTSSSEPRVLTALSAARAASCSNRDAYEQCWVPASHTARRVVCRVGACEQSEVIVDWHPHHIPITTSALSHTENQCEIDRTGAGQGQDRGRTVAQVQDSCLTGAGTSTRGPLNPRSHLAKKRLGGAELAWRSSSYDLLA